MKRVLVHKPMRYGEFIWETIGVPAGRSWILVDLDAQILSIFRDGHEVGTAVIAFGADEKPTPLGHFSVLTKREHHRSSLYGAPMPFTLRLTEDGIAIHGSEVARGAATHGCIGVPTDFAARLFKTVEEGDQVLIVRSRKHLSPSAA